MGEHVALEVITYQPLETIRGLEANVAGEEVESGISSVWRFLLINRHKFSL